MRKGCVEDKEKENSIKSILMVWAFVALHDDGNKKRYVSEDYICMARYNKFKVPI